ncbi:MAG: sulfurtransferase [Pseudomonadota bacterium]
MNKFIIAASEIPQHIAQKDTVILDCRFSLADPGAGRALYDAGHIPGAHYMDLNRDLSAPVAEHGGRHPLPAPETFAATLAAVGIGLQTPVIAYDDSRLAFASRLWWMMRSLGYRPPVLLNGGYAAWLASGGEPQATTPRATPAPPPEALSWAGLVDIEGLRALQREGATLVDSREEGRYQGLEEPMDPVAGHIPGALNRPWQGVTRDDGYVAEDEAQRAHWGELAQRAPLIVYCGSGVTACVNLLSLASVGRDDAILYGGSWSDWCSYL